MSEPLNIQTHIPSTDHNQREYSYLVQPLVRLLLFIYMTAMELVCHASDGPIGRYFFDGNAEDSSGNNHHGDASHISYVQDRHGRPGAACRFDGNQSRITLGDKLGNFGRGPFTIAFWVRTDAHRSEAILSKRPICNWCSGLDIRYGNDGFGIETFDEEIEKWPRRAPGTGCQERINDGKWRHLAFIRTESTRLIYVNGVLRSERRFEAAGNVCNSSQLVLGWSPCVGVDGTHSFSGDLDDLVIYGRALSDHEIAELAEQVIEPNQTMPKVRTLTEARRQELGLFSTAEGVELLADFGDERFGLLPKGIVIESIFHRHISTEEEFRKLWLKELPGAQLLVGYWTRGPNGIWVWGSSMIAIPEFYKPHPIRREVQKVVETVSQQHSTASKILENARSSYQELLRQIASRSADMEPQKLAETIKQARESFMRVAYSPEVAALRTAVLDAISEKAPLAQRILIRTLEKSAGDRDTLVVNLAAATLTGGSSVVPLMVDSAISSSFDVLAEEGILSEDQARVLRGASTLLQAINGIQNPEDLVATLGAVKDAYSGLIEIGAIDESKIDPTVRARIKSGAEILDVLIKLNEK